MECLLIALTGETKSDINQYEDNKYANSILWLMKLFNY